VQWHRFIKTCDFLGRLWEVAPPKIPWIPSFQYIRKTNRSGNRARLTLIRFPTIC
jgi:hypothetical protein